MRTVLVWSSDAREWERYRFAAQAQAAHFAAVLTQHGWLVALMA